MRILEAASANADVTSVMKDDVDSQDDLKTVQGILEDALYSPIDDLLKRPAKQIRADLVRAGFLIGLGSAKPSAKGLATCMELSQALESIHAGSLIVDDIQDGSRERRGHPTLHERYGIPLALNAGNYLYFQSFAAIEALGLDELVELKIYRLCHEAMLNAHLGQALDLGAKVSSIDRHSLYDVSHNTSRLKTGALTALALTCGAALAGASKETIRLLHAFGEKFGVALQRFDDIGNLKLSEDDPKCFEDLRLARPSWAWALASVASSDEQYQEFLAAAERLPKCEPLKDWFSKTSFFAFAQNENERYLDDAFNGLKATSPTVAASEGFKLLVQLADKLRSAYGTQEHSA